MSIVSNLKKFKGDTMKNVLKLLIGILILISLLLSACAPPPPPVTKDQLDTAEKEAIAEEESASQLQAEKSDLEAEFSAKEAELRSLKEYHQELQVGK